MPLEIDTSLSNLYRKRSLKKLPPLAKLALAAKSVRLLVPEDHQKLIQNYLLTDIEYAFAAIERVVASGKRPSNDEGAADKAWDVHEVAFPEARWWSDLALKNPQLVLRANAYWCLAISAQYTSTLLDDLCKGSSIDELSKEFFRSMFSIPFTRHYAREVQDALSLLERESKEKKWTPESVVPKEFFTVHSVFLRDDQVKTDPLIQVVPAISEELIARLRERPIEILYLNPREFEELVAKILYGFGFDVEMTARTRDGGRDVIAIDYKDRRKYLIECKHYRTKKVGIGVVQRLNGVVTGEGATKGIIATTSKFTEPARRFLDRETVKWRLQGRDYDGLLEWLQVYERLRLASVLSSKFPIGRI